MPGCAWGGCREILEHGSRFCYVHHHMDAQARRDAALAPVDPAAVARVIQDAREAEARVTRLREELKTKSVPTLGSSLRDIYCRHQIPRWWGMQHCGGLRGTDPDFCWRHRPGHVERPRPPRPIVVCRTPRVSYGITEEDCWLQRQGWPWSPMNLGWTVEPDDPESDEVRTYTVRYGTPFHLVDAADAAYREETWLFREGALR